MKHLYRILLLTYPRSFRRRFGDAMMEAFEEQLLEARRRLGGLARLGVLWHVIRDTLGTVLEMRWASWRGLPGAPLRRGEKISDREPFRRGRRSGPLGGLKMDVRFALRGLRRDPTFSTVAIVTLALGIGASAAVLSVFDAVVLRPLPFEDPSNVVRIREIHPNGETLWPVGPASLIDWREQSRSFTQIAAIDWTNFNLAGGREPLHIPAQRVSSSFFTVLGVDPLLGRTLLAMDDAPGAPRVAVLSEGLWKQSFGGDPEILGRTIRLDEAPYTVIGVMPGDFVFPMPNGGPPSLWTAGPIPPEMRTARNNRYLGAIARLQPGVTVEQARSEMKRIVSAMAKEYPGVMSFPRRGLSVGVSVRTLHEDLLTSTPNPAGARVPNEDRDLRASLFVLAGAVGIVLLIGWVNVTNLLVARTTSRRREFAVRAAIGAGRGRVVRQLLTETLLLSTLGGLAGLALARGLIGLFKAAAPATAGGFSLGFGTIPLLSTAEINGWVALMTLTTCLVTAVACGLLPAVRVVRSDPQDGLKAGKEVGGARGPGQKLLVSLEVSLALMLLIGAGLMASTISRISEIPLGFEPQGVEVLATQLNQSAYSTPAEDTKRSVSPARNSLVVNAVQQIAALPTVEIAAASTSLPMRLSRPMSIAHLEGLELGPRCCAMYDGIPGHNWFDLVTVTPDYFKAMGIRLVSGRAFTPEDDGSAPLVAIINQRMLEQPMTADWPGRRLKLREGRAWRSMEVVGVVGGVNRGYPQHRVVNQYPGQFSGTRSTIYVPFNQPSDLYTDSSIGSQLSVNLIARHSGDGEGVRGAMSEILKRHDTESPVTFSASMDDFVDENLVGRRFQLLVISTLSVVALLLALVGVYGVMAFQVSQRVHEIGVRMALGARATEVVHRVVSDGSRVAVLGVLMGVAGAMAATRWLSSWLYGVSPTEPVVFLGLAGAMVAVAVLACLIPARRAARVDPIDSLRAE